MTKVLLAGDHFHNTKAFNVAQTQREFSVNGITDDGYELLLHLYATHEIPDVLILNVQMRKIDSISLTIYIKHHFPVIKIIFLSMHNDPSLISQALDSGADGFLMKDNFENNLITAIKNVEENKVYVDPQNKNSIGDPTKYSKYSISEETFKKIGLTKREQTFLLLSATKLQYAEIAKLMFVETATVQSYFERVAKKLQVNSRQELTLLSLQYGLTKLLFYQIGCFV